MNVHSNSYYLDGRPDDIGHELQLFLNRDAYADRWDVFERINEPQRHPANPVLVPDQPWEYAIGLPNVLYDEDGGIFRMWYANYDTSRSTTATDLTGHRRIPYMMSYAESADGVHWNKPLFDRVPYVGHDRTNIVFTGVSTVQEFHVLMTPEHLRSHGRYMVWYRDVEPPAAPGVYIAYSDDGIAWQQHGDGPVYERALDAEYSPIYDETRDLWLLYARPQALAANEKRYTEENVRTRVSVTVSRDLKTWTPARSILVPDELDRGGPEDAPRSYSPDATPSRNRGYFFDRMSAMKVGNQYVGFLTVQPRDGGGRGHIELTSSADGLGWHRSVVRRPFIGPGAEGQWDAGHTWMVPTITAWGHYLYLYYVGSALPWRVRYPDNLKGIGLARVRRDRFVGQYAGPDGGWLLSREVVVTGNRLTINCSPEHRAFNFKHHGDIRVELLDRTKGVYAEQHLDGFSQDDCDPIFVDEYEHVVTWNGDPDLSSLRGKAVHLRFFIKSAYLFGFRFADA